ncbi:hypothetical protein [uncultured Endozoicomonas sp.]|uniref:hypothetical protein n=1 Tax=uncultured Endozoicomonas sp. TaxID=432652 RepID=UPI002634E96B|nr:hypothetical protein [uncultured Endozoicomonas sp.]
MKGFNVNHLAIAIALAGYGTNAVAATGVEDAGHIDLGPVEMTPMATLGVGHDDNVYREGEGDLADKSSTVYKLDASAGFKAQQGLSTYETTLAAKRTSFSSQSDAGFTDFGITGKIHEDINSRNRLDVDFDLGRYHDTGSTVDGATDKSAPEYTRTKGGLKYGFGGMDAMFRADVFGNYNKQKYQKTKGIVEGSNRKTTEYGTTGYYRFMPKTDVLLEIKERKLDYTAANEDGYDVTSYLVGLNWEATGKTTGYAKFGRRERDSQVPGVKTEGFNGWEVGVSYMPVDHSVFQLSTTRDYGFDSENPDQNNTLFTKGTTSTLSWNHQWTGKISTNAGYTYTNDDIENRVGVLQKTRTVKQFNLGVDWNVMRNATVSLSYQNTDRNESAKASNDLDSYKRNAYMLTGTIAL